jgi:hypothetical protein
LGASLVCGIAGFIDPAARDRPDGLRGAVEAMSAALRHRGPDGHGSWIEPAAGLALGHRRLAIIDLSDNARQPFASADGRLVVTYNGEMYSGLDIFCLSSAFGEGAPNVVVEAMACEVPSVVTDVGDSAALVGGFGRVAPPRDSAALARALVEFARMPPAERRTLGRSARQRIDTLLSMESLVSETGRVLAAAVQRRRALSGRHVPR